MRRKRLFERRLGLDEQERPAKEIQRQKDIALAKEKSRPANNMNFRP